jgi:methyltransferase-like protein
MVEFVAQSSKGADTPYQRLLQSELKHLGQMEDYYLQHEHLEEHNQPLYFHEFARRLAVNGLQYLGDADFSTMVSTNFSPEVSRTLQELGAHDIVQMEQYMDFVRCRYFRKTLLCRSGVRLNRTLTPAAVKGLLLASDAAPAAGAWALDPAQTVAFESAGYKISCKSPLTKIALRALRRDWPMPVAFADLLARCRQEAAGEGYPADAGAEEFLAGEMLTGMAAGVVEWRLSPVPFTTEVADMPAVTPLARLQAAQGYKVTNLRGELVTLDEIHRQALQRLDGTRSRVQLTEALMAPVRQGNLVLQRDSDKKPVTDEGEMRKLLGPALDKVLHNLARRALLLRPGGPAP